MRIKKYLGALTLALPLLAGQAVAEEHFRGDIRRFHEHDMDLWRGGFWRHEAHEGRLGWWWVVGGIWYYYARPIYPYPDPYLPPEVVVEPPPPPVVVVPTPPAQHHYFCRKPEGYYPYVARCLVPWQRIEAVEGVPPPSDAVPMPPAGLPPPGM